MKRYVPPTGDEPLDDIERALVRYLVSTIAREIVADAAADAAQRHEAATHDTAQPIERLRVQPARRRA